MLYFGVKKYAPVSEKYTFVTAGREEKQVGLPCVLFLVSFGGYSKVSLKTFREVRLATESNFVSDFGDVASVLPEQIGGPL